MLTNSTDIKAFSIGQLFSEKDTYLIPVYQRNYEWEDKQIVQLLEDIKDYYIDHSNDQYYIGTLVVNRKDRNGFSYETIDGQQRLTTFNLLICALRELCRDGEVSPSICPYLKATNIHFESRPMSEKTIEFVFNDGVETPKFEDFNTNIVAGVKVIASQLELIKRSLNSSTKEEVLSSKNFNGYLDYLFGKVIVIRVQVPLDTDLNHYFEIMNSRGEQLEMHEILKSRMMRELSSVDNGEITKKQFNIIWEACSQMDTYVQLLLPRDLRENLFGRRWFEFIPKSYDAMFEIMDKFLSISSVQNEGISFSEVVEGKDSLALSIKLPKLNNEDIINDSDSRQYQPIINFENFLLHTLKILKPDQQVSLDDKRLLEFFNKALIDGKAAFVKSFAYQLLKCRFLLDQYVIKRKYFIILPKYWTAD